MDTMNKVRMSFMQKRKRHPNYDHIHEIINVQNLLWKILKSTQRNSLVLHDIFLLTLFCYNLTFL